MKLKGSIAVFAVAALFAGSAAAIDIEQCQLDIGFTTYVASKQTASSGAWTVVTDQAKPDAAGNSGFTSNNSVGSCAVPKGKRLIVTVPGPMTSDQCSMYNTLGSASGKLNSNKPGEAWTALYKMDQKLDVLYSQNKLSDGARTAIRAAIVTAQTCINTP
jgi:hypothetical protein